MKQFIACWCCCVCCSVVFAAAPPLVLPVTPSGANISADLQVWLDPSSSFSAHQVLRLSDAQWQQVDDKEVNYGFQAGTYWFRFNVADQGGEKLWLEIDVPSINELDVYSFTASGKLLDQQRSGLSRSLEQRSYYSNFNYLQLNNERGMGRYLLQVKSNSPIEFRAWLFDEQAFERRVLSQERIYGGYFGLIAALVIYNLFLFFSVRETPYLYYVASTFAGALVVASIQGYLPLYFFSIDHWITARLGYFSVASYIFAFTLLTMRFLEVQRFSVVAYRFCQIMCWWCVVLVIMASFDLSHGQPAYFYSSVLLVVLLVTVIAIMAIQHQVPGAKLFLLANATTLFSGLTTFLTLHGFPSNLLTANAVEFGTAAQGLLLSIALAEKIKVVRQDNLRLQQENVAALQQANKTKDEFLSTVSHELRTPMNGVVGCLELIKAEPQKLKSHVDTAMVAAGQMTVMIENILTFSELQAQRCVQSKEILDQYAELARLQSSYADICKEKGIGFHIDNGDALPRYIANDGRKFRIIISRLIDNAIEYTSEGEVRVAYQPREEVDEHGVLWVEVTVTDTGEGIAPNKQAELFDSFHQLETSFTRRHGGLGIGLAIVKALCEVQNGSLSVQSELGKGSCFTALLPYYLVSDAEVERYLKEAEQAQQQQEPLALVVEDNKVNQMVLCRSLNHLGINTITADNGELALQALAVHDVALIFMDCQMPVMDGYTATEKIRRLSQFQHTPIIAVTANASERDRAHCLSCGMNDFIKKPVRKSTLQIKLQHWGFAV